MRTVASLLLLLAWHMTHAQDVVLINEIQAANHATLVDPSGRSPDWIELYNPSPRSVSIRGMRIAIAGKQHLIDAPLQVAPMGYLLLWCSGASERGPDHIGSTLPKNGGTVLLIAADGVRIMDHFTWPAMTTDISMGRLPDGARTWSHFEQPTPGAPNKTAKALQGRSQRPTVDVPPGPYTGPVMVTLAAAHDDVIHYTLDGTAPTRTHGKRFEAPLELDGPTVLRSIASGPGTLVSPEFCGTYLIADQARAALFLVLDPEDLTGADGINVPGERSNHTRQGKAWERPGMVMFPNEPDKAYPVGIRIHGSGSRGLPKRSFKLVARNRYSSDMTGLPFNDGSHFREGILRADAGSHAFLRNLLLGTLVHRHALEVELQPSTQLPVYLNDRYWGLYRWMPPKDTQWLKKLCGAEAVDVLEGPSGMVLSGSDRHFRNALRAMLSAAPMDSIDNLIDTRSLIDLACIDLWSGRADHDINVRCYRPRQAGGRWRWVLFDMDLWAPAEENSVERMCSASLPETPYIPYLLAHPELEMRLLARISALQAAAFAPATACALADSLHRAHAKELRADHARWELELEQPTPEASLQAMKDFINTRPAHLFRHLAEHSGRKLRIVVIEVPPPHLGQVLLEGLQLPPGRQELRCFSGIPMHLEARAAPGMEFANWKGLDADSAVAVEDLSRSRLVRVEFRNLLP